jgi:hypothetical protein
MPLKTVAPFAVAAVVMLAALDCAMANAVASGGQVVVPPSSVEQPGDAGKRAHTNVEIFVPYPGTAPTPPSPGSRGVGPPNKPSPNPERKDTGDSQGSIGTQRP